MPARLLKRSFYNPRILFEFHTLALAMPLFYKLESDEHPFARHLEHSPTPE